MLSGKNIGTQGVQTFFSCEWKALGGGNTQWTLNSYDKVNATILFGYDVQREKETNLEFISPWYMMWCQA